MENYTIVRHLGSGTKGKVFLVRNNDTAEFFTMKKIEKITEEQTNVKLLKDYYIPTLLKCKENIICVVDAFEDEDYYYIISEYYPGAQDMFDFRLHEDIYTLIEIALIIAKAVKSLHDLNIIHRDIKLENILLVEKIEGEKKSYIPILIDYDLSCIDTRGSLYPCAKRSGTYQYAAPELFTNAPYNPKKIDIYSLGVLFYLLFSDYQYPYQDSNLEPEGLIRQTLRDIPYVLNVRVPLLKEIVASMLEKNSRERPDIDEVIYGLENVLRYLEPPPEA